MFYYNYNNYNMADKYQKYKKTYILLKKKIKTSR